MGQGMVGMERERDGKGIGQRGNGKEVQAVLFIIGVGSCLSVNYQQHHQYPQVLPQAVVQQIMAEYYA